MKTPVIIPAYNEERNIAILLNSLPAGLVDPIVAVNGSSDRTAEIAASYGVEVYNIEEKGMLPAIQYVLKKMGRKALEPFLQIDADVRPFFPNLWHNIMLKNLRSIPKKPVVVAGPILFEPVDKSVIGGASAAIRSITRLGLAAVTKNSSSETGLGGGQYGPNIGFHIQNQKTLERVLSLDHFWPLTDVAITDAVVNDGEGVFKQILNPAALLLTPESDTYPPIRDWVKYGLSREGLRRSIAEVDETITKNYIGRGAPGSKPFILNK